MKYRRVYRMLVRAGHSPLKAGQILLDAVRGQRHAVDWIVALSKSRAVLR